MAHICQKSAFRFIGLFCSCCLNGEVCCSRFDKFLESLSVSSDTFLGDCICHCNGCCLRELLETGEIAVRKGSVPSEANQNSAEHLSTHFKATCVKRLDAEVSEELEPAAVTEPEEASVEADPLDTVEADSTDADSLDSTDAESILLDMQDKESILLAAEDSALLSDSQLLTDSELLGESSQLHASSDIKAGRNK